MHWSVVAPFFRESSNSGWLTPFVPGQKHQFSFIPRRDLWANLSWHKRASRVTGYGEWLGYWNQSGEALAARQGGIITVFPQLAATVGLRQTLSLKHVPVVAWAFNIGTCYPGIRRRLAQTTLKNIDRFVVHSRHEQINYSQWLGLPLERFNFVPLQAPEIPVTCEEETTNPFILALGSANRDYPTLLEAVRRINLRTIIVARPDTLAGLDIPPQVELRSGLTYDACHCLAQQAWLNIIPLLEHDTASGQVTIVNTMRMSRPLIATRCTGSEDYIESGVTGFLVDPSSVDDLTKAIITLRDNRELRTQIGKEAGYYAAKHFSDEAAGLALGRILDEVAKG